MTLSFSSRTVLWHYYYYCYYYYLYLYLLYIGYSLVCPLDKQYPYRIHCCSYSFVLLSIRCMVHISLVPTLVLMFFYVSTFRRMCTVPNMAVLCSSRISWLPGMLPAYFLNDFEVVLVAPVITGITVVFTFYIRWISIVRSLYFKIFISFFFDYITISWDGNIYIIIIIINILVSRRGTGGRAE